ncbi:MAG: NYN domain-containing protein [Capsulimonadales bacterium]|nr:NYN domain-containing protein [Capsulimonadales bacterium]
METRVAVFIDFENIKRAVDEYFVNERVDLKRIFEEIRRVSEGRVIIKRAYADWGVFKDYRSDLLDNATEPVQAFALTFKGKNGADIRIAIDVMDVVLRQEGITHIALVTGDSDFTPLVNKLREFGRTVIGLGVRSNTSTYLAKSCDIFCYYDDLRDERNDELPQRAARNSPENPTIVLMKAMANLGNKPVPGSALKQQMRRIDPLFDEVRAGHASFLEFLRANQEVIDVHKPAIGDVQVAPKGMGTVNGTAYAATPDRPNERNFSNPNYTPYQPSGNIPYQAPPPPPPPAPSASERLRLWLRDNNFRPVPADDRHRIINVMFDLFQEAEANNEDISLKEAKDRLHLWFEENRPSVPWESINSTVYHLFYTWCFHFDRSDENKQLWDQRTTLASDIHSAEDLIAKSERNIVRKVWERERQEIDPDALNDWLYDGDPARKEIVVELIRVVSAGGTVGSGYGAVRGTPA